MAWGGAAGQHGDPCGSGDPGPKQARVQKPPCHTGPYTVPTAQCSLFHHPFPGQGKCQGRDGFWGAGWGACCAHPPVLLSANPPPHTHPTSCSGGHPPVPTPYPTPPWVLSLFSHKPRARGVGREGRTPHHPALPAPGLASPSQPRHSALKPRISPPGKNGNGSEFGSALTPGLGLNTFCSTILEQPREQSQEGKP